MAGLLEAEGLEMSYRPAMETRSAESQIVQVAISVSEGAGGTGLAGGIAIAFADYRIENRLGLNSRYTWSPTRSHPKSLTFNAPANAPARRTLPRLRRRRGPLLQAGVALLVAGHLNKPLGFVE